MKKRRIVLIFVLFLLCFIFLFASSSFFSLNDFEFCLFEKDENNTYFKVNSLNVFNTNLMKKDFGKSIFKVDKNAYIKLFEEDNPEYRVLKAEYKFPNKICLNVCKRKSVFFIKSGNYFFVLDEEFKIIKEGLNLQVNNEIEINGRNLLQEVDYFEFFEINSSCLYGGYFLTANNTLINSIKNFCAIFSQFEIKIKDVKTLTFFETNNTPNLEIKTTGDFGVKLIIENIENEFDKKLSKILFAVKALLNKDKIKTTYGRLLINNDFNCFFYEN